MDPDGPNPLRAALRLAYHRSGLTQGQVSARAEVSDHTVARVLTDPERVHMQSLMAVCRVFGLRVAIEERQRAESA